MNNITEEHFLDFLRIEKCYDSYFNNIMEQSDMNAFYNYVSNSPMSLISGLFTWSDTNEGNRYWCLLSDKWKNYLDNIKKINKFSENEPHFKLFIRFLKENDCYHQYFNNLNIKWKYKILPISSLIIDGFDWGNSKEGIVYWDRLSKKWTKIYRRYSFLHKK